MQGGGMLQGCEKLPSFLSFYPFLRHSPFKRTFFQTWFFFFFTETIVHLVTLYALPHPSIDKTPGMDDYHIMSALPHWIKFLHPQQNSWRCLSLSLSSNLHLLFTFLTRGIWKASKQITSLGIVNCHVLPPQDIRLLCRTPSICLTSAQSAFATHLENSDQKWSGPNTKETIYNKGKQPYVLNCILYLQRWTAFFQYINNLLVSLITDILCPGATWPLKS